MQVRDFSASGPAVSEIGLGTWQLGGTEWGNLSDEDAIAILSDAVDAGITFIDTADIYGGGRSETLIGKFLKERSPDLGKGRDDLFIATKIGRRSDPGWPENFTPATMRAHIEDCLKRQGTDSLDLVQLHCIDEGELEKGDVFEALRGFQKEGLIKRFGASVETVSQAKHALKAEGIASLQIIYNVLRQTMAEEIIPTAETNGVAIIVRLPLASGLLAGKYRKDQTFAENDHRNFNRDGEAFYVGETFAGLPFEKGVELVEEIRPVLGEPAGGSLAQMAQRWVLDNPAVTTVITGASSAAQARSNAAVSDLAPLSEDTHVTLQRFYRDEVLPHIRGEI